MVVVNLDSPRVRAGCTARARRIDQSPPDLCASSSPVEWRRPPASCALASLPERYACHIANRLAARVQSPILAPARGGETKAGRPVAGEQVVDPATVGHSSINAWHLDQWPAYPARAVIEELCERLSEVKVLNGAQPPEQRLAAPGRKVHDRPGYRGFKVVGHVAEKPSGIL
ncbi:hypothetical protein AB0F43_31175 [Kribbella sp. NPDC023972]|uniref:hypothetical protein n=1 Tax=Kribbella sp. NPDC023972 TaxID=3154795 RepID=UPI0033E1C61B